MPDAALWTGIRVWYPPFDPHGKYYRTKYVGETTKVDPKTGNMIVTVEMALVPEEELHDTLVVNLTPEAKRTLDEIVTRQTDEVLRRAATIARKRKAQVVSDGDVKEAIKQLEEEQK